MPRNNIHVALLVTVLCFWGCQKSENLLRAKKVQHQHELIGGSLAHGQIGDYLIENDKVRFIISGAHHSWGPGLLGGTVVDADLRRTEPQYRGGRGKDQFSELFPTVNLVVADPVATGFTVLNDGAEGNEAAVKVAGRGVFYLEALGFLDGNRESDYQPFVQALNIQGAFQFKTTYSLKPGQNYLKIETEVQRPDTAVPGNCEPIETTCDKPCDNGYQTDPNTGCLVCECDKVKDMPLFTEPVPLLGRIMGDSLDYTQEDALRPGTVAGDFLFFGGKSDIFIPGLGFDEKGKVFDNLFQNVDTITSPLSFDWMAAAADDVSYAYFTRREATPENCLYRVVVTALDDPTKRDELVTKICDTTNKDCSLTSVKSWLQNPVTGLVQQKIPVPVKTQISPDDIDDEVKTIQTAFEGIATIDKELDGDCRDPKLLAPLFTSSASMAAVAGVNCLRNTEQDDKNCDVRRNFKFTRYLAVGSGDISSAVSSVFEARGVETGTVTGLVFDKQSGRSVKKADVYAITDPGPDADISSYDTLIAANLANQGNTGVVNHARADVGTNPKHTGRFNLTLPVGNWIIVARSSDGVLGPPMRINIVDDETTVANPVIDAPGRLSYRVVDSKNQLVPAKITLQAVDNNDIPLYADGKRRVELGDGRRENGIFEIVYAYKGEGTHALEAGRYKATVSRGFEYSIDTQMVTIKPGKTTSLAANIKREIDTSGYVSGDFHLHAEPSLDSGMFMKDRVATNVVEGVELLSSSDHDVITNYMPTLKKLGLDRFAKTQVGLEISTLELGHFLSFPLKYNDISKPIHDAIDWVCKTHDQIFEEARNLGLFSKEETALVVAHPRDGFLGYFDQFGLDAYTMDRGDAGLEAWNPLFKTISCDFDAMEVINSKRFEIVRTPTISEVVDSERCLEEINEAITNSETRNACDWLQQPKACKTATDKRLGEPCNWYIELKKGFDSCQDKDTPALCKDKARNAVGLLTARRMLYRTQEEQNLWQQAADYSRCKTKLTRLYNDDLATFCDAYGPEDQKAAKCDGLKQTKSVQIIREFCAGDGPENLELYLNSSDTFCTPNQRRKVSSGGITLSTDDEVAPCVEHEGVLDDWFQLLNHGLNITAMGNSDSHGKKTEPGIPRNFIASSTDDPQAIDLREISSNLKAHRVVATTGPFINASINNASIGETTTVKSGDVIMKLKVQTPSWFGISRIEIYRNGQLEKAIAVDKPVSDIVDFDEEVTLKRPDKDSWYVVLAMGLRAQDSLDPVYMTVALGELTLSKIMALAIANLPMLETVLGRSSQVIDYFPALPYAVANPIWVDLTGDGFEPPQGPPGFCPIDCKVSLDDDGNPTRSNCPALDEVCLDKKSVGINGDGGICGRDIPGQCDLGMLSQEKAPLMVPRKIKRRNLKELETVRFPFEHSLGRWILNMFVHPVH